MKSKKQLKKAIKRWTYRLGLRWWHVTFVLTTNKKLIKDVFRDKDTKKGETIIGRTYADWKYRTATIYINVPALKGWTERKTESMIVHELMHVLVNEMRETGIHHEERVATSLTEAIFWTVDDLEVKQ
jgi:predicted SprT family Zn-dependent metalloprotease